MNSNDRLSRSAFQQESADAMQQESDTVRLGVPRELGSDEQRVALVPQAVSALSQRGFAICLETGAGAAAGFRDEEYVRAGAEVIEDRTSLMSSCEVILQVRAEGAGAEATVDAALSQKILIAMCDPLSQPDTMAALAAQQTTCFALELVPRITRAQSMDVLSSMDHLCSCGP